MGTAIYYFSGTGNSLYVAKDIAEGTGGALIPMASVANQNTIRPDPDAIGIVFPVYYGELPVIVKRFAERLEDIERSYIFAVSTFGGSAGHSFKLLGGIVQARGGAISATYRVHMPQNSFSKPWENHATLFSNWRKKLGQLVSNTNGRAQGEFFKSRWLAPLYLFADGTVNMMKPRYRRAFIKLSNAPPDLSTDELIHRNDTSYWVDEKCNGCGVCSKVCPVVNIQMAENRPVWLHQCENCLACYNWCPSRAVQGGVASKGYYYRHPDIKIAEIMGQRSERPG
jgi:ferredoxin/flavodoxin